MPTRCPSCQSIHLNVGTVLCRRCHEYIEDPDDDPSTLVCWRCGDVAKGSECSLCGSKRMVPRNERYDEKHDPTMNLSWKGKTVTPECHNCGYSPDPNEPEPFCSVCGHNFVKTIRNG